MPAISVTLRGVILSSLLSYTLFAGVTYDETVRYGNLDASLLVRSRVPGIDPPAFDIPLNMYAPPLRGAPTRYRVLLEEDRLVRIGKDETAIFDLKAHTLTVVFPKTHAYSIETMDEARKRLQAMLKHWSSSPLTSGTYTTEVQKTGQTRQVPDQTAEEYRIIAFGPAPGRRRVAASSIYWMVPKNPSEALAAFALKWSHECGLPFPGTPSTEDDSVFGAMARAASKLPGYPILFVVVDRPLPGAERTARREVSDGSSGRVPQTAGAYQELGAGILLQIHVTGTAFSNFVDTAVEESQFTVPAGYKKKKASGYPF